MSACGSPSKACEGLGGPAAPTRPARLAHDRPRAPGMECAYLKVSHVLQRTGPFFGKPPEAFGEAAWRWPRGPWSLSREVRWVRRPGLLGPGAPSASPGRYGTPQPWRAPRTLGRALASGLRLLRAGTSVPEPGGRRGAGGPGSRSPARPAKTQEVGGGSNATQSGLDRISAPRRAGDRARAGLHGDTCPWAPGPRGFLTLAGLNAAWNCAKWLRGVGQFFFLDPQNTVTYPTILEGLSQRTFINISAKCGERGPKVSCGAGAPSPSPSVQP